MIQQLLRAVRRAGSARLRTCCLCTIAVLALAAAGASPASAQFGFLPDEVKLGALAHDVGFLGHHVENGADVNLEVLFPSPLILSVIGSPRPHIGADIHTRGKTTDGYFGLTWGITLLEGLMIPGDGIYANGSLGGAIHDGYLDHAPPGRKNLGSTALFRESLELGYRFTPWTSVSALLDHISNANLAKRNEGITSAGARLGVRF